MINYLNLGADKQLNEIVMAGSHDAAITQGSANAQTQDLDIYDQAAAGVRIFDIRITGAVVKKGGESDVLALKAYHGPGGKSTKTGVDLRTGESTDMKVKSLSGGTYGMTLSKILADASKFVQKETSEFLILKFDKCDNWGLIAEACVEMLGDRICKLRGNLNLRKLSELRGKVVVLFSEKGRQAVGWPDAAARGILAFQNLKSGGAFDRNFDGLQYFGKGGTSVAKPFGKTQQNVDNQAKLMKKGVRTSPDVMGMMYWTTTGVFESIKERNDAMWTKVKKDSLRKLWTQGLYESIQERIGATIDGKAHSNGPVLKAFMPNFVMVDFADEDKCETIFDLNTVASVDLTDAATVLAPIG